MAESGSKYHECENRELCLSACCVAPAPMSAACFTGACLVVPDHLKTQMPIPYERARQTTSGFCSFGFYSCDSYAESVCAVWLARQITFKIYSYEWSFCSGKCTN